MRIHTLIGNNRGDIDKDVLNKWTNETDITIVSLNIFYDRIDGVHKCNICYYE